MVSTRVWNVRHVLSIVAQQKHQQMRAAKKWGKPVQLLQMKQLVSLPAPVQANKRYWLTRPQGPVRLLVAASPNHEGTGGFRHLKRFLWSYGAWAREEEQDKMTECHRHPCRDVLSEKGLDVLLGQRQLLSPMQLTWWRGKISGQSKMPEE